MWPTSYLSLSIWSIYLFYFPFEVTFFQIFVFFILSVSFLLSSFFLVFDCSELSLKRLLHSIHPFAHPSAHPSNHPYNLIIEFFKIQWLNNFQKHFFNHFNIFWTNKFFDIKYSRLSRSYTARGSCNSLVTVGPLKYKVSKSLLFTKDPSVDKRKNTCWRS